MSTATGWQTPARDRNSPVRATSPHRRRRPAIAATARSLPRAVCVWARARDRHHAAQGVGARRGPKLVPGSTRNRGRERRPPGLSRPPVAAHTPARAERQEGWAMKAPPLGYVRASTLAEAFQLWREAGPEAKLLAGGQSLLAALAFRLSEPSVLIDITRLAALRGISADGNGLRLGALTTHAELGADATVKAAAPLFTEAVPLIAHPAVRNRGTIGGSLAYADPAAELAACAVALEANIVAQSATRQRRIPATAFFRGLYTTALEEHELIAAVEVPKAAPASRGTILAVGRRRGDYAMAGLVAWAGIEAGALIAPRLVFFGVGQVPVTANAAMAALSGTAGDQGSIARAQAALDADLDPPTDLNGGPAM